MVCYISSRLTLGILDELSVVGDGDFLGNLSSTILDPGASCFLWRRKLQHRLPPAERAGSWPFRVGINQRQQFSTGTYIDDSHTRLGHIMAIHTLDNKVAWREVNQGLGTSNGQAALGPRAAGLDVGDQGLRQGHQARPLSGLGSQGWTSGIRACVRVIRPGRSRA